MTSTAVWWLALAAGTLLLVSSGVRTRTRAAGGRRIPRLGFSIPPSPPWWTMGDLLMGSALVTLAAGRLDEDDSYFGYLPYLVGAFAIATLLQSAVVWRHNRRLEPESSQGGLSGAAPGVPD
ncbi:hypothetical protein [Blastococcus goldschmidtiae]|uniref:Integral membrane protein n=1 Tax=Blastococcus goldschmidtiae TaxID=3075546 RepID=A0ABU2K944_9ACTN|nr:hypothetical protein [Blastococcus sp. DSM 46792]MDT0276714.1 hypothetical protein [Blastococcus sp. DSM 46792]